MKIYLIFLNFTFLFFLACGQNKDREQPDDCNKSAQNDCRLDSGCYFYADKCSAATLAGGANLADFQKDTRIFSVNGPKKAGEVLSKMLNVPSTDDFDSATFYFKKGLLKG